MTPRHRQDRWALRLAPAVALFLAATEARAGGNPAQVPVNVVQTVAKALLHREVARPLYIGGYAGIDYRRASPRGWTPASYRACRCPRCAGGVPQGR